MQPAINNRQNKFNLLFENGKIDLFVFVAALLPKRMNEREEKEMKFLLIWAVSLLAEERKEPTKKKKWNFFEFVERESEVGLVALFFLVGYGPAPAPWLRRKEKTATNNPTNSKESEEINEINLRMKNEWTNWLNLFLNAACGSAKGNKQINQLFFQFDSWKEWIKWRKVLIWWGVLRNAKGRQAHASQTTSFLSGPNPKRNGSGMAAKRIVELIDEWNVIEWELAGLKIYNLLLRN